MAAVEAVTITKAKYENEGNDVEVHVMPYTAHSELRKRLENKWFSDVEDVKYYDSLEGFVNEIIGSMYAITYRVY